tara:strand:- start:2702 stop:3004 length:303 start_codon:yes stop_codon:yes gene_type:complete
MKSQICSHCNIEKDIDQYPLNKQYPTGYTKKCKECNKELYQWNRHNPLSPLEHSRVPEDRDGAIDVLVGMGYEIYNPENSVYNQFKTRMKVKGHDVSGWD